MKKIIILGSTGSVGQQSLKVLQKHKKDFLVIGLTANQNEQLLRRQKEELGSLKVKTYLAAQENFFEDKVKKLIDQTEVVINAISGVSGILPTQYALRKGKTVLLANKESIVAQGKDIMKNARDNLIPIDSEHNAVFEILKMCPNKKVKKIILPCSGGPFLGKSLDDLKKAGLKEALSHPSWNMGKKISIESATLLNKGLEVIEAHYLFNQPLEKIEVWGHPRCQIHGVVEFEKSELYGYVSSPNMEEHIENGLLHCLGKSAGPDKIKKINPQEYEFVEIDRQTFPGIKIVVEYFKKNRSMKKFLEKEEDVVNKFLNKKIKFLEIFEELNKLS
ncbi:saccharopine dehydrogenase NADP-binding domain-containing protein [Patescibacteria group bacterium]